MDWRSRGTLARLSRRTPIACFIRNPVIACDGDLPDSRSRRHTLTPFTTLPSSSGIYWLPSQGTFSSSIKGHPHGSLHREPSGCLRGRPSGFSGKVTYIDTTYNTASFIRDLWVAIPGDLECSSIKGDHHSSLYRESSGCPRERSSGLSVKGILPPPPLLYGGNDSYSRRRETTKSLRYNYTVLSKKHEVNWTI